MPSSDEYEITLIDNEIDADSCAKLLAEEYIPHNPLTICSQRTADDYFNQRIWPLMIDVLEQKLSFLIRHRPTNDIFAVITGTDLYLHLQDLYVEILNQFVHYDFGTELKPNMVLKTLAGATRSDHEGKALATQLRSHVCSYT
ncbi:unnamed protein product [Rotaria sp. Silwood1]|nr:unnamed protein product [Rotaria sp. Silwood1]CAF3637534.1 unnamed protein product [Rotaria sp. Silwood1]CAF4033144.1 unnamed protein product [Rotaria sp. Silwood1]CAF4697931.1 unnamed protein product [Rotaria sp. Silwood1]CAF4863553.1 unnamed protein product [Rotaria sp. Silwood1]